MATATEVKFDTLQDLVEQLGNIPLNRIRMDPLPGRATEADVLEAERKYNRLCELVDGVLVEKTMGYTESRLAAFLIRVLLDFVLPRNLGVVTTTDGTVRLFPGLVRIPDVAFASWDRFPDRKVSREPIPTLAPDLVIEVLSASNTSAEMERKRGEYFSAGVRLIWEVEPKSRSISIFTPDGAVRVLENSDVLDGSDVLPGFTLKLSELFAEIDRHG
jgi:Uma2 family endonuclease